MAGAGGRGREPAAGLANEASMRSVATPRNQIRPFRTSFGARPGIPGGSGGRGLPQGDSAGGSRI